MRTSAFEFQTAPDSKSRSNCGAEIAGDTDRRRSDATNADLDEVMSDMLLQEFEQYNSPLGDKHDARERTAPRMVLQRGETAREAG